MLKEDSKKITSGEKYAAKVINKKLMQGREFLIVNEIDILTKISMGHGHIITLYDYFETPNNRNKGNLHFLGFTNVFIWNSVYLIMDL